MAPSFAEFESSRSSPSTAATITTTQQRSRAAIVGAGPAGYALAVDLEDHGTSVLVYSHPSHQRHTKSILAQGGQLRSKGLIDACLLPRITSDMSAVVAFATVIIITVPSTGQETIWRELARFDLSSHVVIAVPGNLFSMMRDFPLNAGWILETNLSPYSCRMDDSAELVVLGKKKLVSIAMLGKDQNPRVKELVEGIFPMELLWCRNVVEVCLSNINGVFHPLMVLMNAGRIESTQGDFFYYAEGLTPSVAKAIRAVDEVRIEVGRALGFKMKSVVAMSNECYNHDFKDLVDLAQNSKPHRRLKAPEVVDTRNISEDVGDLLVCWHGLAEKLGIDNKALTAVIALAGMTAGKDYLEEGRNLTRLGLQHSSREEILEKFRIH
jgi:hypothetical protein